jgi:hypothetical protein
MQVFIKTCSGKTITVETMGEDTVEALKTKISDKEGFPAGAPWLHLLFDGRDLEDGRTLAYYNMYAEAQVQVLISINGGGQGKGKKTPAKTPAKTAAKTRSAGKEPAGSSKRSGSRRSRSGKQSKQSESQAYRQVQQAAKLQVLEERIREAAKFRDEDLDGWSEEEGKLLGEEGGQGAAQAQAQAPAAEEEEEAQAQAQAAAESEAAEAEAEAGVLAKFYHSSNQPGKVFQVALMCNKAERRGQKWQFRGADHVLWSRGITEKELEELLASDDSLAALSDFVVQRVIAAVQTPRLLDVDLTDGDLLERVRLYRGEKKAGSQWKAADFTALQVIPAAREFINAIIADKTADKRADKRDYAFMVEFEEPLPAGTGGDKTLYFIGYRNGAEIDPAALKAGNPDKVVSSTLSPHFVPVSAAQAAEFDVSNAESKLQEALKQAGMDDNPQSRVFWKLFQNHVDESRIFSWSSMKNNKLEEIASQSQLVFLDCNKDLRACLGGNIGPSTRVKVLLLCGCSRIGLSAAAYLDDGVLKCVLQNRSKGTKGKGSIATSQIEQILIDTVQSHTNYLTVQPPHLIYRPDIIEAWATALAAYAQSENLDHSQLPNLKDMPTPVFKDMPMPAFTDSAYPVFKLNVPAPEEPKGGTRVKPKTEQEVFEKSIKKGQGIHKYTDPELCRLPILQLHKFGIEHGVNLEFPPETPDKELKKLYVASIGAERMRRNKQQDAERLARQVDEEKQAVKKAKKQAKKEAQVKEAEAAAADDLSDMKAAQLIKKAKKMNIDAAEIENADGQKADLIELILRKAAKEEKKQRKMTAQEATREKKEVKDAKRKQEAPSPSTVKKKKKKKKGKQEAPSPSPESPESSP